ncbi:hypothetical protein ACOSQ3_008483 [Xanthoceras sorbifolium]
MGTGIRRDTVPASKQNFVRGADGASVPLSSNQQATSARHAVITLDDSHAVIPRLLKVPGEVRGVQSSDSAGLEGFSKSCCGAFDSVGIALCITLRFCLWRKLLAGRSCF